MKRGNSNVPFTTCVLPKVVTEASHSVNRLIKASGGCLYTPGETHVTCQVTVRSPVLFWSSSASPGIVSARRNAKGKVDGQEQRAKWRVPQRVRYGTCGKQVRNSHSSVLFSVSVYICVFLGRCSCLCKYGCVRTMCCPAPVRRRSQRGKHQRDVC